MNENATQRSDAAFESRELFDTTFRQHIERLTGLSQGIDALSLNLATISSIILFAEQSSNEMEGFQASEERYTETSLLESFDELGLGSIPKLDATIQEMVEKGYIIVDKDQKLYAGEPTLNMAQLLDQVFPTMPGMNLIAYLAQTYEEVVSGRKDVDSAINQLDEILHMQGVWIHQDEEQTSERTKKSQNPLARETLKPSEKKNILKRSDTSNYDRRLRRESRIISADNKPDSVVIKEVNLIPSAPKQGRTFPAEKTVDEDSARVIPASQEDYKKLDGKGQDDTTIDPKPDVTILSESEALPEMIAHEQAQKETTPVSDNAVPSKAVSYQDVSLRFPESQTDGRPAEDIEEYSEDTVDRNIVAFEEDLGMQCPLCIKSKIRAMKTSTGKTYYKCSDKNCQFISWGKPYHYPCPRCQNPFLVETKGKANTIIYKCPRATCRHWQESIEYGNERTKEKGALPNPEGIATALKTRKPRKRRKKKRVLVRRKK